MDQSTTSTNRRRRLYWSSVASIFSERIGLVEDWKFSRKSRYAAVIECSRRHVSRIRVSACSAYDQQGRHPPAWPRSWNLRIQLWWLKSRAGGRSTRSAVGVQHPHVGARLRTALSAALLLDEAIAARLCRGPGATRFAHPAIPTPGPSGAPRSHPLRRRGLQRVRLTA